MRSLAIALASLSMLAGLAALLLADLGGRTFIYASPLVFVGVAAVLTLRRPGHPVGWLLLGVSFFFELTNAADAYAWHSFVRSPGSLPFGTIAAILKLGWVPGVFSLLVAILLFPTGRLPSPRWRIPFVALLLDGVAMLGGALLGSTDLPVQSADRGAEVMVVPNPLFVGGPVVDMLRSVNDSPIQAVIFLVPAAAIVMRLRGSRGVERQQTKVFAYAALIAMAVAFVSATDVLPSGDLTAAAPVLALDLIAVAVAAAILRYRLYDIDILIRRTLVYGVTTAALAGAFFGVILLLQAPLGRLTGGSELAVALSTVVCYALFQPLRRRVQEEVDHRFYRARYDATHLLDELSIRLRDQVELEAVRDAVVAAARDALRPEHVALWLRRGRT